MAKKRISKKQRNINILIAVLVILVLVAVCLVLYKTGKLDGILEKLGAISAPTHDNGNGGGTGSGDKTERGASYGTIDGTPVKVHFVFVGQGDGIVVELPENKYMLVDAGSGLSAKKVNKERYYSYLDEVVEGNRIDYLVVTHPDSDHVNMMSKVLDDYEVKNLYYNDYYENGSQTYRTFMDKALAEEGATRHIIDNEEDSTFEEIVGACVLTFFSPGNDGFTKTEAKIKNGMSIMILLRYGGRKLLLTGDAPEEEEEWFVTYTENFAGGMDVDFLKVAHHGSKDSSCSVFLAYVKAEYAIISVDANDNKYGHPTEKALNRLADADATVYRTDTDGTITLTIDSDGDYLFTFTK